ncbi:MAG: phosphoglucosamine mutase [Candidatus Aminicenantes bacterium]|nr:phosphoglucosamine mutase [Candidatus Aminicenantes bacterium]
MRKLFGTDGIRGVANKDPMTPEMAIQIGQAVTHVLNEKGHRQRIVIGKDTRLSGYMLENALAAGISSMGADVISVGPMPTPGIAFIANNMDADCGIVISASHNPFEDNGIKIFSKEGFKLSEEQEFEIEELIFSKNIQSLASSSQEIGRAFQEENALEGYIVFLRHTFPKNLSLEGVKIVLDCANGATYKVAPTLFKEMRAEVLCLNVNPDGKNINVECGSLHPELLAEKIIENRADIGLALDGDGDRLIAADEKGNIISGDKILAICAKNLKKERRLKNDLVVSTVMSNLGLSLALNEMEIKHIRTRVGDRYVLKEMLKNGAVLGGEDSGHIIFLEHHTTGDGLIAALQLLAVMQKEEKAVSELSKVMKTFPQVLINVDVKSKPDLKGIPEIGNVIGSAEKELGDKGRVLVRYSGTQPMCRVMVEGPTKEQTEKLTKKIAEIVKKKLN